ncbi:MAG: cadherin-like domain-containing protein, partial [Planctomycetaceae bacterium]|nr:cadherin-like domain-containing protein [Planctomycetaceae bacterium]
MPFDWLRSLRRRCTPRRPSHIRRRKTHLAPSTTPCEPRILLSTIPIGSEFLVNSYTTSSQSRPVVAADSNGDYVIAWESYGQDGYDWGIFAQRFSSTGIPQGPEFQVNTYTGSWQLFPSIAVSPAGDFVIAWQSIGADGNAYGISARRYNADGVPQGPEFQVNSFTTGSQTAPSIAINPAGDFVITWMTEDQNLEAYDIHAQRFNSLGVPQGLEFQVNTYTTSYQFNPAIAMDSAGDFVIAWESDSQDGDNWGIFAQRYDSAGIPQGPEFLVNSYTTFIQISPSVAMENDGDFVIAWNSYSDGDFGGIYSRHFNSSGVPQGSEIGINSYTTFNQRSPVVAVDANGDTIIAWGSLVQDGDKYGVFARRLNASGSLVGDEFQVNTYTTESQQFPGVAFTHNGEFVIAWESVGQDDSFPYYGVYAQRYQIVNDPPTAVDDTATTPEDTPTIIDLLENDTDPDTPHADLAILPGTIGYRDSDGIFHSGMTPSGGTVSLRPDGRVDYTPAPNFNGQDTFEYALTDGVYRTTTIGGEMQVNSTTENSQGFAQVAMDADGDYVVVWTNYGDPLNRDDVFAQRFHSSGVPVGLQFRVNLTTEGFQNSAYVAMDAVGNFVVAWENQSPVDGRISVVAQWFDALGHRIGGETVINDLSHNVGFPAVAMNSSGETVIVWTAQIGGGETDLFGKRFNQSGEQIGDQFQIISPPGYNERLPSVAMNSDGSFVLAWEDRKFNSETFVNTYRILVQQFDPDGVKVGNEFQVNDTTEFRQSYPTVAMNSSGDFVVTWSRRFALTGNLHVVARRYSSDGTPLGDEIPVDSSGQGYHLWSQVAMRDDGSFVISWEGSEAPGSNSDDVFARRFDPEGNPIGSEFRVNTTTSGEQFNSDIAMDDRGNFVIVWDG